MEIIEYILRIVLGLITLIPLVVELVKYVKLAVKERNWQKLVVVMMSFMTEAESMFEDGSDKKSWVMTMLKSSADSINYELDEDATSELIDNFVELTKKLNTNISLEDTSDIEDEE